MDDKPIYLNFLINVTQVGVARAQNELVNFAHTFRALLSSSDKEIDDFVKNTHNVNSTRVNNARILIFPVLFEL